MKSLTGKESSCIMSKMECRLLECLRKIKYGQVTIYMDAGQPIRVGVIRESIKL